MVKTGTPARSRSPDDRCYGGDDGVVATHPDSLRAPRDERTDGFVDGARIIDIGFEQRQIHLLRSLARLNHERERVRLGGIPCDPDARERGQHPARELERPIDGRKDPLSHEMRGMLARLGAVEADTRRKRIGHQRKHVAHLAVTIVVRHGLHRRCAGRDHEVVGAAGDLAGDRNAGRHVALRVEPVDHHALAGTEPPFRQGVHRAADPLVEDDAVCVLENRDTEHGRLRSHTAATVGEQQNRRGQRDQSEAESETPDYVQHVSDN